MKAIVITGPQGCGKSTLAREMARKHGSFEEVDARDLDGHFGIGDALAMEPNTVIVDGSLSPRSMERLKSMIMNKEVVCNRKYQKPVRVNTPNFIICTGSMDAIQIMSQDRRFFVIDIGSGRTA